MEIIKWESYSFELIINIHSNKYESIGDAAVVKLSVKKWNHGSQKCIRSQPRHTQDTFELQPGSRSSTTSPHADHNQTHNSQQPSHAEQYWTYPSKKCVEKGSSLCDDVEFKVEHRVQWTCVEVGEGDRAQSTHEPTQWIEIAHPIEHKCTE